MRQDSLTVHPGLVASDSSQTAVVVHPHELTPAEVLSWLPKDATPAQQDSAIQQHIKVSEIRWSEQPDTLHMPGMPKGKSYRDVELPQYYRETFLANKPYFNTEAYGGRQGVAGDPVPYTLAGDNLLTGILVGSFILSVITLTRLQEFIVRQVKTFFRVQREATAMTETSSELWGQLYLVLQTCLLFGILSFLYTRTVVSDTFIVSQPLIITYYTIAFFTYFLLKGILYWGISLVFFDMKKNEQWIKFMIFIISVEGILLFPLVLLLAYFDVNIQNAVIYVAVVVFLAKLLSFYRTFVIFFEKKALYLQFFLYLCALEITPLMLLGGSLMLMSHYLKVIF